MPFVSVVICTYNRASLLKECLESLTKQNFKNPLYEIIVVDNNSTDDTKQTAIDFQNQFEHFCLVKETRQGLSHARNRGFEEAKGDYVIYLDDDTRADENWLNAVFTFIRRYPDAQAFGGPFTRYSRFIIPPWLPEEVGLNDLGKNVKAVDMTRERIVGCNMGFKKSLLYHYGGFDTDLGYAGEKKITGEETALLKKAISDGHDVYYVPEMRIAHFLSKEEMTFLNRLKNAFVLGLVSARVRGRLKPVYFYFYDAGFNFARFFFVLFWWREQIPYKRQLLYAIQPLAKSAGAFAELLLIATKKIKINRPSVR